MILQHGDQFNESPLKVLSHIPVKSSVGRGFFRSFFRKTITIALVCRVTCPKTSVGGRTHSGIYERKAFRFFMKTNLQGKWPLSARLKLLTITKEHSTSQTFRGKTGDKTKGIFWTLHVLFSELAANHSLDQFIHLAMAFETFQETSTYV